MCYYSKFVFCFSIPTPEASRNCARSCGGAHPDLVQHGCAAASARRHVQDAKVLALLKERCGEARRRL